MTLSLTSPAFDDGEAIPRKYGYENENVNPPLAIADVPDGAESLVLLMDDPDARAPAGKVWDHWTVFDLDPSIAEIPEDWSAGGATEGRNDYGETGYGGPNPPDREHAYRFRLYALDATLDLDASASKEDVEAAMEGRVLAEAQLEGTYAP
jgi:hypothetical protein